MRSAIGAVTSNDVRRVLLAIVISVLAFAVFGAAYAVQDPRVVHYTVAIAGLKQPLRLVQISDSHASWIDMPPARLARVVARANALHPDMIVLTGDYIGGKLVEWPEIRLEKALYPLGRLAAPLGVFAVQGNHDSPLWTPRVFARTHVRLLVGQWVDVGPLLLVGADDLLNLPGPVEGLAAAVADAPPGKPMIALSHEPEFFQWLPPRVQLLLAGHTHGGQIWLPGWPSLDGYLAAHRRGLFTEHGQTMIVSSGLGTSVVPLRIGVPPEIVVITLVPKADPRP